MACLLPAAVVLLRLPAGGGPKPPVQVHSGHSGGVEEPCVRRRAEFRRVWPLELDDLSRLGVELPGVNERTRRASSGFAGSLLPLYLISLRSWTPNQTLLRKSCEIFQFTCTVKLQIPQLGLIDWPNYLERERERDGELLYVLCHHLTGAATKCRGRGVVKAATREGRTAAARGRRP